MQHDDHAWYNHDPTCFKCRGRDHHLDQDCDWDQEQDCQNKWGHATKWDCINSKRIDPHHNYHKMKMTVSQRLHAYLVKTLSSVSRVFTCNHPPTNALSLWHKIPTKVVNIQSHCQWQMTKQWKTSSPASSNKTRLLIQHFREMKVHCTPAPPLLHYDRQKNLYPDWCQEANWKPHDVNTSGYSDGLGSWYNCQSYDYTDKDGVFL